MDKFPIDDVIVDMFAFYEKKVYLKDHHIEGYFFSSWTNKLKFNKLIINVIEVLLPGLTPVNKYPSVEN